MSVQAKAGIGLVSVLVVAAIAYQLGQSQTRAAMEEEFIQRQLEPVDNAVSQAPDHMTLIQSFDDSLLEQGQAVYQANCVVCHGEDGQAGVGGARKLGQEPFQNTKYGAGANLLSMYDTLTNGWNVGMPAQAHLPPVDRYAVIHYMREQFIAGTDYYRQLDEDYLAELTAKAPQQAEQSGPPLVPGVDYPHPLDEPMPVPVYGVLAQRAQATEQDQLLQDSERWLRRVAEQQPVLKPLVGTEIGRMIYRTVQVEDPDGFRAMLQEPSTVARAPRLALLRQDEVQQLYQSLSR
jgi:cytochrome c5